MTFFLEEYSDFKEDGIYGCMAKVNNALSLAALCNEAILIAGKVDDLVTLLLYSSRSTTVPVFGMETVEYWQLVHGWIGHAKLYLPDT